MTEYSAIANIKLNAETPDDMLDILLILLRDNGFRGHITVIKDNGDSIIEVL